MTTRREGPFVIGVTGNIACGKSSVLAMLGGLGAATIDADAVYHRLIAPGMPLWKVLVKHFGDRILGPGGAIDRQALAAIVFSDREKLAVLDRLTHPAVIAESQRLIAASQAPVVAIDAVKLIESGMDAFCDQVWVVTCRRDQQIERLMVRNGFPRDEAERRVDAQPPVEPKIARADVVIDNSGAIADTQRQVQDAWRRLSRIGLLSPSARANE